MIGSTNNLSLPQVIPYNRSRKTAARGVVFSKSILFQRLKMKDVTIKTHNEPLN